MDIFSLVLQFGEIVNCCLLSKSRRHVIWENSCLQNTFVSQGLFYFFLLGLLGCPGPYYCIAKVLMKIMGLKIKGNNCKECTAACFFMHSVPFLQIRYLYNRDFTLQNFCQNTDGIHLKISGCLTQAGHVNSFENEMSIKSLCFGFLIQWEFCH